MPRLTAVRKKAIDEIMKEAIFDATVSVLHEHGVEGMTMDRVASAAGVAKGSLYNYFRSKTELLQFVYAKTVEPILQDLARIEATTQPAIEKLALHLRNMLDHLATYSLVFKLLFQDDVVQGFLLSSQRASREAGSQHLAEIFRQGIAEGAFRPADPFLLALMFFGLCKGVFESNPELEGCDQRENLHQLIMGTFLNGIASEMGQVG